MRASNRCVYCLPCFHLAKSARKKKNLEVHIWPKGAPLIFSTEVWRVQRRAVGNSVGRKRNNEASGWVKNDLLVAGMESGGFCCSIESNSTEYVTKRRLGEIDESAISQPDWKFCIIHQTVAGARKYSQRDSVVWGLNIYERLDAIREICQIIKSCRGACWIISRMYNLLISEKIGRNTKYWRF